MKNNTNKLIDSLREKAEKLIAQKGDDDNSTSVEEFRKLLQNLDAFQNDFELQQKQIENELLFEKNRLELIYKHIPVAVITLDELLKINSWNPKAESITGYTELDVIGHYVYDILKFNFPEKILFEDILNQGKVKGLEIKTSSGEIRYINFGSDKIVDYSGINHGYIVTLEDITSETITNNRLLASEMRIRSIIEKTPIGMCITNDKGIYEFVNPAYCKIYKYFPEELIGQHFTIVVNDDVKHFFYELHDRFINEGEHVEVRGEWDVVDKYGNKISILADAARIIGVDNRPKKVTFVIDVSEMKKVEASLRKATAIAELANQSKSEFLANMSHEIRTPLNAILGFSELLKNKKFDSDKYDYYLDGISVAGINLLSLINDILDLSKIEAGRMLINPEPVDILELCEEVFKIFIIKITEKDLKVETKIINNIPIGLILDEIRIRQILFNIVGNAVKFTESGKISIVLSFDKENESRRDLNIAVIDTGIGIPESQVNRIFEPFMQTEGQNARKYGGTGLGLPISKRLLEMMNGSIEVESTLGVGTKFHICIRGVNISEKGLQRSHLSGSEIIDLTFDNQKVIIIDDNMDNIEIISGYLKNVNLELYSVNDYNQTIEHCRKIHPALILLNMPIPEIDGYELIHLLNNDHITKNIPIIAITSASLDSFPLTTRLYITGFIRKPFTRQQLINEIARIIPPVKPAEVIDSFYMSFLKFKQSMKTIPIELTDINSYLYLQKILLPSWETVNNSLIIDKIKDFGKSINEFACSKNIELLKKYSDYLNEAVNNMDIECLIEILPFFIEIAKKIKSK